MPAFVLVLVLTDEHANRAQIIAPYPMRAQEPRSTVISLLDLENIETDVFRGLSPKDRWQRVYGGQVLGQALVAASRTVENRTCHSLHGYFLRPGDPSTPILYEVDRSRDGGSFSARRVVAIQHGLPIFTMSASFAGRGGIGASGRHALASPIPKACRANINGGSKS